MSPSLIRVGKRRVPCGTYGVHDILHPIHLIQGGDIDLDAMLFLDRSDGVQHPQTVHAREFIEIGVRRQVGEGVLA
jgi:hypothetical protein